MSTSGTWKVNASKMVIVDVNAAHRYRICSSVNSKGTVQIIVDGKVNGERLKAGECRDVVGKKLEINQPEGNDSIGTFDNLD